MTTHITKKLDHEKGNRRDKGRSPNYLDKIRAEGDKFDRGGTHSSRITLADAANLDAALRKSLAQDKETAARVLVEKLRTLPLKVDGYVFSFRYQNNSVAFAQANNLPHANAEAILPRISSLASKLFDMTKGRFNRAAPYGLRERDPVTGRDRVNWYITFRTFLSTVEPQPWHTFFKRLRLDPQDQEPSGL